MRNTMSIKRFPAEEEYKRHPKLSREVVKRIHGWAKSQPYLPEIDEEDVIIFLTSCQFDEEYAKKTLDLNYTFRTKHPQFFNHRHLYTEKYLKENGTVFYYSPEELTEDGCKVMFTKVLPYSDASKFSHAKEVAIYLSHHELMIHQAGAVNGFHMVFDMEGLPYSLLFRTKPSILMATAKYLEDACPIQKKGIHIIRPNSFVQYMMRLLKPCLSSFEHIFVHSSLEDFYKHLPKKNILADYGGDLPSIMDLEDDSRKRLIENLDILIESEKRIVNEQLRPNVKEGKIGMWRYFWG